MTARRFDPMVHASTMRAQGYWLDRTVDTLLSEAVAKFPKKTAVIAYRNDHSGTQPVARISYLELSSQVSRAASSLLALGVGRGDIVAVQLPNWWEFVVITLAAGRVGAVVNPLMPIFRERELGFMLTLSEAKLLVIGLPDFVERTLPVSR